MSKAILSFKLPEEQEEFDTARRGINFSIALERVGNEIFRPARKHGYQDAEIQKIVDEHEWATALIGLLEERFYEILTEEDAHD